MTARPRLLVNLTPCAVALLLALGLPPRAAGQAPPRDTTAVSAQVKDLPLTATQRQAFVGTYSLTATAGSPLPPDASMSLRIFEENGVLMAKGGDEGAGRLLYQGDNVFRPEGAPPDVVVSFVLEKGRATKVTIRKEDGVIEGVRAP